jgi:hypothetical protein
MMDETPVTLKSCCQHLRHKMMYCDSRHATRGKVDDSSDTRVLFCVKTGDALGPDGQSVCVNDCQSGRRCHRDAASLGSGGVRVPDTGTV